MRPLGGHGPGIAGIQLDELARRTGLDDHRTLHAEESVDDMAVPVPRHLLSRGQGQHDHAELRRLRQDLIARDLVARSRRLFHGWPSVLMADIRAAYDSRRLVVRPTARLSVAEGERVAADLSAKIPVGIDEDGEVVVLSGQLTDERLGALRVAARKNGDAPESAVDLVRDPDHEIPLVQPWLVESPGARRPMAAAARNDRVALADPVAFHIRDRLGREDGR